ncbi:hypothetical protein [Nguyenibacter sp. L1]|uniref:hypothetical protein n=1 Tax=Nguyenibacter sp. L1 TaxID=3049350 RepID=UPI002B4A1947|nr:hypothetical protein [Nguyenibacter sp. L1]WRH89344.1 hypothetical protein QN315_07010 [Nguyenibacter sp. L1]
MSLHSYGRHGASAPHGEARLIRFLMCMTGCFLKRAIVVASCAWSRAEIRCRNDGIGLALYCPERVFANWVVQSAVMKYLLHDPADHFPSSFLLMPRPSEVYVIENMAIIFLNEMTSGYLLSGHGIVY